MSSKILHWGWSIMIDIDTIVMNKGSIEFELINFFRSKEFNRLRYSWNIQQTFHHLQKQWNSHYLRDIFSVSELDTCCYFPSFEIVLFLDIKRVWKTTLWGQMAPYVVLALFSQHICQRKKQRSKALRNEYFYIRTVMISKNKNISILGT